MFLAWRVISCLDVVENPGWLWPDFLGVPTELPQACSAAWPICFGRMYLIPPMEDGVPQLEYLTGRKGKSKVGEKHGGSSQCSVKSISLSSPFSISLSDPLDVHGSLCQEVIDGAAWAEVQGFDPVFWQLPCHDSDFFFVGSDFVVDT